MTEGSRNWYSTTGNLSLLSGLYSGLVLFHLYRPRLRAVSCLLLNPRSCDRQSQRNKRSWLRRFRPLLIAPLQQTRDCPQSNIIQVTIPHIIYSHSLIILSFQHNILSLVVMAGHLSHMRTWCLRLCLPEVLLTCNQAVFFSAVTRREGGHDFRLKVSPNSMFGASNWYLKVIGLTRIGEMLFYLFHLSCHSTHHAIFLFICRVAQLLNRVNNLQKVMNSK